MPNFKKEFYFENQIAFLFFAVVFACFSIVSCGSDKLSRESASKIIQASDKLTDYKTVLSVHKQAFEKGKEMGFWENTNSLTEAGRTHFLSVPKLSYVSGVRYAKLTNPIELTYEITGIIDDPSSDSKIKFAEFNWRYSKIPSVIKRFAVAGGYGRAKFTLYDDGWRLSEVGLEPNDAPYELTQEEKDKEKLDIASYKKLKADMETAENERIRKAKVERDKLIKEASTPTKTIGTYKCINEFVSKLNLREEFFKKCSTSILKLTDVDASYVYVKKSPSAGDKIEQKINIWFGNIKEINVYKGSHNNNSIYFKLHKGISIGPGHKFGYLYFKTQKERDNFYNDIKNAKAKWNESYPSL